MFIYQVDSFTNKPFSGNPAAVCLLHKQLEDTKLQHIAAEMNLSETAFLLEQPNGWNLRWFTPTTEVDLCGHATLASAHILWETGELKQSETATFQTKSGILTAGKFDDWIMLEFPREEEVECNTPEILKRAINDTPFLYVGKNRLDYLVELESEETVKNLNPDFSFIEQLDARGVIVTARSSSNEYDFVSRYFCPKIGIKEDPVTGSTHCALSPYWSKKFQKKELTGYQLSERGGAVKVVLKEKHVGIGGQAITVLKGEIVAI